MIDWNKVAEAIVSEPDVALFDIEEVLTAVVKTSNRYLEKDREAGLILEGLEEEFEFSHAGQQRKGFIDLRGWRETFPFVCDYKSTGTLDERWAYREENSEQTLYYAHALHVVNGWEEPREVLVHVRGVDREGYQWLIEKTITPHMLVEFDQQSGAWSKLQLELWAGGGWKEPWPRNKPEGCRPFGPRYPCDFEALCNDWKPENDPARLIQEAGELNSSFSSNKEFRRCPERRRLLQIHKLLGTERGDSPEASWGQGFHRGIAEVYRQEFGGGRDGN